MTEPRRLGPLHVLVAEPEAGRFFCEWASRLELPFVPQRCAETLPAERP